MIDSVHVGARRAQQQLDRFDSLQTDGADEQSGGERMRGVHALTGRVEDAGGERGRLCRIALHGGREFVQPTTTQRRAAVGGGRAHEPTATLLVIGLQSDGVHGGLRRRGVLLAFEQRLGEVTVEHTGKFEQTAITIVFDRKQLQCATIGFDGGRKLALTVEDVALLFLRERLHLAGGFVKLLDGWWWRFHPEAG